jgi:hypothetical protein
MYSGEALEWTVRSERSARWKGRERAHEDLKTELFGVMLSSIHPVQQVSMILFLAWVRRPLSHEKGLIRSPTGRCLFSGHG